MVFLLYLGSTSALSLSLSLSPSLPFAWALLGIFTVHYKSYGVGEMIAEVFRNVPGDDVFFLIFFFKGEKKKRTDAKVCRIHLVIKLQQFVVYKLEFITTGIS